MKHKTVIFFSLMLLLAFVGCSDSPTDTSQSTEELDLSSEFGGYTATSESYAFNEPQLITESSNDVDFNDPILSSAGFDSLAEHPFAGRYHMRIVWGQLRYDSTHTSATDWSGSLQISRGGEVIRRLIHWELNQDFILPRTERTLIEWQSQTTVHNDGIAIDLIVPPLPPIFDSSYVWEYDAVGDSTEVLVVDTTFIISDDVEVTFTTGPYSRTFSLQELESLDTVVTLSDSNAVAFHALKLDRRECPAGFFNGFWGYDENGQGLFRGMWIAEDGSISGFVKGHYGVNDRGENVLFGKYVGRNGQFEGFIKGRYHENQDNMHDSTMVGGMFQAEIFNTERAQIGVLDGRYRSSDSVERGFMQGRWKNRCRASVVDSTDDTWNDGM